MTEVSLAIVTIATLAVLVSGRLLFGRIRPLPGPDGAVSAAEVSVIIPARNEEGNLAKLLPLLSNQSAKVAEVLVVDDGSGDRTGEVARQLGAKVHSNTPPPDGWLGKPWACQQGAERAIGRWLLFLDADTEPAEDLVARLMTAARKGGVVSVCPWHRIERRYEERSRFFNLLMNGAIGAFTWKGRTYSEIGLFGQCLLVDRESYRAIEGHRRARDQVLENFALAREWRQRGVVLRCFAGKGTLAMRMFPEGPEQLRNGWAKGFVSGAGLTGRMPFALISVWLSGLMAVAFSLLALPFVSPVAWAGIAFGYFVSAIEVGRLSRWVGGFRWSGAMVFPVSLFFYQWLFLGSCLRKRRGGTVDWKGRHVG